MKELVRKHLRLIVVVGCTLLLLGLMYGGTAFRQYIYHHQDVRTPADVREVWCKGRKIPLYIPETSPMTRDETCRLIDQTEQAMKDR